MRRDIWDEAQRILNNNSPSDEVRSRYTNRYPLSGKIKCGYCGHSFSAKYKRKDKKTPYKGWHCNTHSSYGNKRTDENGNIIGCDMSIQINERDFMLVLSNVVKSMNVNKENLINELCDILSVILKHDSGNKRIKNRLKMKVEQKNMLLDLYLEKLIADTEYKKRYEELENEILLLKKSITEFNEYSDDCLFMNITSHIKSVIEGDTQDELFYKYILNKIVVHSREEMDVYLNSCPYICKVISVPESKEET